MILKDVVILKLNGFSNKYIVYTEEAIKEAISRLFELHGNSMYVEILFSDGVIRSEVDLVLASHVVENIRIDKDSVIADIRVLEKKIGKIMERFLNLGCNIEFKLYIDNAHAISDDGIFHLTKLQV